MNPAVEAEARRAVIACAERLLSVREPVGGEGPWDESIRADVLRALRDRSYGVPAIETALAQAAAEWTGRAAFTGWLQRFKLR